MITSTRVAIPPLILATFSRDLLHRPKLWHEADTLWEAYVYIRDVLVKKAKNNPKRLEKTKLLEKEFLELYERIKETEEKQKSENKIPTKELFYRIEGFGVGDEKVFGRLKHKS